ncbi:hypothetical protein B0T26DRAFT_324152 [Lasiosphaeria miniovina]|uniref:Secreted protein n=1 Tax=Lasiosphaeria miniovina TaxID=1954250 RepID=A0AA40E0L4_9PEZI|nr:uncharacterized protein B0T26DRAFT_324152 [Lasiosphaeria miniovina]KAK0718278.1 hypothetical protein B0T26DRAFT_324152 [Lasiosphaeria miniovina]
MLGLLACSLVSRLCAVDLCGCVDCPWCGQCEWMAGSSTGEVSVRSTECYPSVASLACPHSPARTRFGVRGSLETHLQCAPREIEMTPRKTSNLRAREIESNIRRQASIAACGLLSLFIQCLRRMVFKR